MKVKPPKEGSFGDVPEHLRDSEESYWLEQAAIDDWIAKVEAGEPPPSVPITGEWSTVREVAARHRVKPKTIRARIHDGSLTAIDESPAGTATRQRRYRIHRDAEIKLSKQRGEPLPKNGRGDAGVTFEAFTYETWWPMYVVGSKLSDRAKERYASWLDKHLIPRIGGEPIGHIEVADVLDVKAGLAADGVPDYTCLLYTSDAADE